MSNNDTYRDSEGFGRDTETGTRGVWSAVGPDDEDHGIHCLFIAHKGILPCTCDATRKEFSQWWKRWLRWAKARSVGYETKRPMPWPVTGPDGDPWVPGIDFNDVPETPRHTVWCNVPHYPGTTPCRVFRKVQDSPQA